VRFTTWLLASLALALVLTPGVAAAAARPAPAWSIEAVSQPTHISPTSGGHIAVLVTNDGGETTAEGEPVTVTDTVPEGLHIDSATIRPLPDGEATECTWVANTVSCTFEGTIAGDNTQGLSVVVGVSQVGPVANGAESRASVSGGGAAEATAETSVQVSAGQAPFGVSQFHVAVLDAAGGTDTQAGDHPNLVSVGLQLNTVAALGGEGVLASEPPRSLAIELPVGLIGNPRAAPTCRQYEMASAAGCPANTAIGTISYWGEAVGARLTSPGEKVTPIYNIQPEQGYPVQFAFEYNERPAEIYGSLVHRQDGYLLRLSVPAVSPTATLAGVRLSFFGDPALADGAGNPPAALFTTPSDCGAGASALQAKVTSTSWTQPASRPPIGESASIEPPSGCSALRFSTRLEAQPQTTVADTPTGLSMRLALEQDEAANGLATPPLEQLGVTLPVGMSLSLPAGQDLTGCGSTEIGLYEEQPGPDGEPQPAAGRCPRASVIGSATIATPLLKTPLRGNVYLAKPECAPCSEEQVETGMLVRVYVEAEGSGINLKLPGMVEVGGLGPHTRTGNPSLAPGQMRLQLEGAEHDPQLPISEVQLDLNGGAHAFMANPYACGPATATAALTPWGGAFISTPQSIFTIGSSETGGCPVSWPFAPSFAAGSTDATGGAHSPFSITFARHDREQPLAAIHAQLPPGVSAAMRGVPRCPEPQAGSGQCSAESLVGHVHVALGPGPQPLWVEGAVYLTEPYGGAPFGLTLVIPAVSGPFDLGEVVVRAAVGWNSRTGAISVSTTPLPASVAGVPLRVQTVSITLDRPGFTGNPTDCAQEHVTATIDSRPGATVPASMPFAVGACVNLPFRARLTAHSVAKTTREQGAYLHLQIYSGAGQANLAKLHVVLPKQLNTRLSALQKACPVSVFEANPAGCPAASVVGHGTLRTPLLKSSLSGPAYFLSNGGAAVPDLVLLLQGEGVLLELEGSVHVRNEITTASFDSLPDMPLSTLSLVLPEGPHSLLGANGHLCAGSLSMSTSLAGQNGASLNGATPVAVSGCPRRAGKQAARRGPAPRRKGATLTTRRSPRLVR
jgi:hypothetical protein